jgi:hypothetical protein
MALSKEDLQHAETWDMADELADRMELNDKERGKFVHTVMTESGFKCVPSYQRREKDEKPDSGQRRNWREQKQSRGDRRPGDDWEE